MDEDYQFSLEIKGVSDDADDLGTLLFEFGQSNDPELYAGFLEFRDYHGRLIRNGDRLPAETMHHFSLRAAARPHNSHFARSITIHYEPAPGLRSDNKQSLEIPFRVPELMLHWFPLRQQVRSDINDDADPSLNVGVILKIREEEQAFSDAPSGTKLHWKVRGHADAVFQNQVTQIQDYGGSFNLLTAPPWAGEIYQPEVELKRIKSGGRAYTFNHPIVWAGHEVEIVPGDGAQFSVELSETELRADGQALVDIEISQVRDRYGNLTPEGTWVDIEAFGFATDLMLENFNYSDHTIEEFYRLVYPQTDSEGKVLRQFRVGHVAGSEDFLITSAWHAELISLPLAEVESRLECDRSSLDIALQEQAKFTATFIGTDGLPVVDGTPVYVGSSTGAIWDEFGQTFDEYEGLPTKNGQVSFILDSRGATIQDQAEAGALVVAHCQNLAPAMHRIPITQSLGLGFRFEERRQIIVGDRKENGTSIYRDYNGEEMEIDYYARIPVEVIGEPGSLVEISQGEMRPVFYHAYDDLGSSGEIYDRNEQYPAQSYGVQLDTEEYARGEAAFYFNGSSHVELPHDKGWQTDQMFLFDLFIKPEIREGHLFSPEQEDRIVLPPSVFGAKSQYLSWN